MAPISFADRCHNGRVLKRFEAKKKSTCSPAFAVFWSSAPLRRNRQPSNASPSWFGFFRNPPT
ncbi:unnamed protein product, partial [Nesidiocoris tenuis]